MNAARFMAGVLDARDEHATDVRICRREVHKARSAAQGLSSGPEATLAALHWQKLLRYAYRVEQRNGVEPF